MIDEVFVHKDAYARDCGRSVGEPRFLAEQ